MATYTFGINLIHPLEHSNVHFVCQAAAHDDTGIVASEVQSSKNIDTFVNHNLDRSFVGNVGNVLYNFNVRVYFLHSSLCLFQTRRRDIYKE